MLLPTDYYIRFTDLDTVIRCTGNPDRGGLCHPESWPAPIGKHSRCRRAVDGCCLGCHYVHTPDMSLCSLCRIAAMASYCAAAIYRGRICARTALPVQAQSSGRGLGIEPAIVFCRGDCLLWMHEARLRAASECTGSTCTFQKGYNDE